MGRTKWEGQDRKDSVAGQRKGRKQEWRRERNQASGRTEVRQMRGREVGREKSEE